MAERRERGFTASFARQSERIGPEARRLRLDTLVRLRWLAVAGQTATIAAAVVLGFRFPVLACVVLVAASAALNVVLRFRFAASLQLSDNGAAILLAYDVMQLAALLFLTGGVANPFAMLLVAPVTIAATSLPFGRALALFGLALALTTVLLLVSLPLPWFGGGSLELPPLYLIVLWAAVSIGAAFVGLYAYQVAQQARQTSSALTAAELVLARVQHLSQLDGLAAAAAHELGTPLATVSLVVREMAGHPPPAYDGFAEDVRLLEEQVERCRAILNKLSSPAELSGEVMEISSPVELVEMAAAPHRLLGVTITVTGEGPEPPPRCARNPAVLFGLGNLIENAVSFAEGAVSIHASWSAATVRIVITDDGAGFPPQILSRVGEPYLSRRDAARRDEEPGGGLGLGLFIARLLLERSRALLHFANAGPRGAGAIVTVEWSRAAYEHGGALKSG